MKVAIIIDTWFPFMGGGQINAWEISRRIAKKGARVDIITRNIGKDDLKLPRNLRMVKLGSKSSYNSLISQIIFCIKSFFFINKKNYDLVHAHAFLPGITIWFLKLFKKVPVIFTVHGVAFNTNLNNFIWRQVEKIILTKILYNAQITVSQDFLKIKNVNKKITYIANGVDLSRFNKVECQKFKQTTLLFVGRLHKQKNLKTLLSAFGNIKKELTKTRLLIVGDGPEKPEIENLIKKLKLSETVDLKGEIIGVNLIKLYKSSHLFILPSIYEGQPITLLEAWAAKLPVIVSNSGDCQYLVKNGYNGYLIHNPQSISEIGKLLKLALGNQNLGKLGLAGYNLVKSFSWDSAAQKTLELYKNVISSKN